MTAMFPASGVPAADARNSLPDAQVNSVNCDELWYSTSRCQPRFDPAAANAMLAEIINTIMKGEVVYDCNYLDRLSLSIRYQIQRNLPKIAATFGTAVNYEASFDPPVTRYSHGMELVIAPHVNNIGPAYLNANGIGPKQIVKGNGQSLKANDMIANYPRIVVFYGDTWFLLGSGVNYSDIPDLGTVPKVLTGNLDVYVDWRDGSDITGTGTLAQPFQTIQGCWNRIGGLYIASPIYAIRIHLLRPGLHAGAEFTAYGGRVEVHGGGTLDSGTEATKSEFKILSSQNANPGAGNPYSICITSNGMTSLTFYGVNFFMDGYNDGSGVSPIGLSVGTGFCAFINCAFTANRDNPANNFIWSKINSTVGFHGVNDFFLNGNRVSYLILASGGDFSALSGAPSILRFHPGVITAGTWGLYAHNGARITIPGCTVELQAGGPTGPEYRVTSNAMIEWFGQPVPGDVAGSTATGGLWL